MGIESSSAFRCDGQERFRAPVDKRLLDSQVTRLFQCHQMCAEIAVGQAELRFEKREVNLLTRCQLAQRGHDLQPGRLMDNGIQLSHWKDHRRSA